MIITLIVAHPLIALVILIGFLVGFNVLINASIKANASPVKKPSKPAIKILKAIDNVIPSRRYNF